MLWVQHSAQATQFRIWATQTLREFIVKGFVLDDERLKLNRRFIGEHRLWSPVSEWWLGQELARMNGCKCKFGQRY